VKLCLRQNKVNVLFLIHAKMVVIALAGSKFVKIDLESEFLAVCSTLGAPLAGIKVIGAC
jgi:hypothetical protein